MSRPRQKWHYAENVDLATLAAAYGFGLVRNHPYRDGNKRVGLVAMLTFLDLNGKEFDAADAEVVREMTALADGRVSEEALSVWIRQHTIKR